MARQSLLVLLIASVVVASPVPMPFIIMKKDLKSALGSIGNAVSSVLQNGTVSGIASTVAQSITNPQLTAARVEVVKGLSDVSKAFTTISEQAKATNNSQIVALATKGAGGIGIAQPAIDNIAQALISGQTASTEDQKNVAVGIKQCQDAVQCMVGAGNSTAASSVMPNPDSQLSSDIEDATTKVGSLRAGGEGVINSEAKGFAALGLPDNFGDLPANCTV